MAFVLANLNNPKSLAAAWKSIANRRKSLAKDMDTLAVAELMHIEEHRNTTRLNSVQADIDEATHKYLIAYGNIRFVEYDKDGKPMKYKLDGKPVSKVASTAYVMKRVRTKWSASFPVRDANGSVKFRTETFDNSADYFAAVAAVSIQDYKAPVVKRPLTVEAMIKRFESLVKAADEAGLVAELVEEMHKFEFESTKAETETAK